jgi:hypothetical protein
MALSNTGRRMVCRSVIHLRSLQSGTNGDLANCPLVAREAFDVPEAALHKNSGEMPDRQFVCFPKKRRGAATASGVGVGEAGPGSTPC